MSELISADASLCPLAACAPGPFSTRIRTVMLRAALTAVFATSLTVSGAAQEFMAQSGVPASSFPKPDRPVAHVVTPRSSTVGYLRSACAVGGEDLQIDLAVDVHERRL